MLALFKGDAAISWAAGVELQFLLQRREGLADATESTMHTGAWSV